ncbi:DUF3105 domain-containing protein [Actinophytocola oryzae]|uniref:Uncharacterized protein DUF3105 n=1 Tax=Actinophytocola oryzae TaxID=502181 RepID=A0A4R7VVR7_9PSEU|nr:DUF3105 domain-containing protein [Actinophytocola oryzae]TDV53972.1 uncharacterized protein DUF3105 [Actinophytocola oryzae]
MAAIAVLAAVVLTGCDVSRGPSSDAADEEATASSSAQSGFTPSEDDEDPAKDIEGVVVTDYAAALHVEPTVRVAYTKAPPDGGRHDVVWADCQGTVYPKAVRNENMVHALEHGAVWIAYDPDAVKGGDLRELADRVDGVPYMMLSPYPGLDAPVSLQAWGHQLKLTDADDERIDQFVQALRENPYTAPEPGARCDSQNTGFDPTNPPPFDPTPPGPGAAPVGP